MLSDLINLVNAKMYKKNLLWIILFRMPKAISHQRSFGMKVKVSAKSFIAPRHTIQKRFKQQQEKENRKE